MDQAQSSVGRFVRRVYRRLVLLRLAEWAGTGFAAGCGLALMLMPLLRNRGESLVSLAAVIAGIGAMIGLIAAALRRPGMIGAAVEADRQLDLADLLATAWLLEKSSTREEFELAVLTIARQRAEQLRPGAVVLHRLGMRAWGGIGLTGALALTVAVLVSNPLDTEASLSPLLLPGNGSGVRADGKSAQGGGQIADGRRPGAITQDHPGGEDEGLAGAGKTTDVASNTGRGQNSDTTTSDPGGKGTGAGQSPTSKNNSKPISTGTNSSRTSTTGPSASGVGVSSEGTGATGNSSSAVAGVNGKSAPVPPWQSENWPAAREAADAAISAGQVPAAYHDLVREYFNR